MKRAFLSLFLVFGVFSASFAMTNATDVYLLAKTENTSELKKVENIDVVDSDGNTALCSAIKFNDVDAYNILKKAGANTEHKCVKKIPSEQYKTFLQKVGAANKSWSFLGLGKWAWAAIGAGVAGGAVAAGMGGGGGGSSGGDNGNNVCQSQGFTSHEPCVEEEGWIQDRFCEDNNGQWYKCRPANCFGYQTSCGVGYEEVPGHTCKSGDEIKVSCQLKTCPYYTTYCATGYHETGNTCQSGETIYTECEADTCEGYNYIQCPSGYVASDTCLSGYTTKYKCETPATCPYNTTECTGGYQETGNTCQSGETLYKECEPKTCPYMTTSCPTGFYGTGNTCLSGENTYVECAFDSEHYIQQGGNVYPKLNCAHGNQVANSCSCETGWSGTLCNIPATCPYTTQSCGTGYVETGNTCQSGNTTYIQCEPVNCPYTTTSCTTGFHATGNTCQSGEVTYVQCEPNACDGYDYTNSSQCPQGYTLGSSCLSGTQMKYMCDTLFQCPYTTTECAYGYIETGNSCQSGENIYVECVFDYEHYIVQGNNVYPKIDCVHGEQLANTCSCGNGWTGTLCDTPAECTYTTTMCVNGYHETGNTCQSGNNTYVECEINTCDGYNYMAGDTCPDGWTMYSSCLSGTTMKYMCDAPAMCGYDTTTCVTGFHETGNTCLSGDVLYKECEADTCDGYNYTNPSQCPAGYEVSDSCLSGYTTKYKCETPATCPYNTTECTGGYQETGNTCQSGETLYKECEPISCGVHAVWSASGCSCESGYQNYTPGVGCYPESCGVNSTQFGTDCYCNPGFTNWTLGYGCYQTLSCGVNATQIADECVCNSGYQDWTEGYGCYETRDCGINANQSGANCVCNPGYQEWTEGYGCYQTLNCGVNAHQNGDACYCDDGYENLVPGVGCSLIELECGVNAVQNGTHCECLEGFSNWEEGIGCGLYGIFATDVDTHLVNNHTITLENNSGGAVYGIKLQNGLLNYNVYNAKAERVGEPIINGDPNRTDSDTRTGTITINNDGDNNIYGVFSNASSPINADSKAYAVNNQSYGMQFGYAPNLVVATATGNINITNDGNGDIYGLYGGFYKGINAHSYATGANSNIKSSTARSYGYINIENMGDGNICGIYNGDTNAKAEGLTNGAATYTSLAEGYINIENTGNGDIIGMQGTNINNAWTNWNYTNYTRYAAKGVINISNIGNGDVYGMKGNSVNNANSDHSTGQIIIKNNGTGTSYGIYADAGSAISNGSENTYIRITNLNNGMAYGMHNSSSTGTSTNGSEITIQNLSNGEAIGMYANGGTLTNSGIININNIGTGTAIGMLGNNNSTINNSGTINITREAYTLSGTTYTPTADPADNVFGIYARSGSTVNNSGTINVTSNGGMYGIYAESGATVTNTGTISLNGIPCNGSACSGSFPYIVLNGSTLYNSGLMMAPQMNLNSMGGNVVAGLGSQFVVENELSGDLNISSELVQNGNQTTYIAENMIDAGDISNLNVRSASAMFDASLADNGHDVVIQMKDFDSLTDNKSLAAFLANNYANGKGMDLFGTLKSMENISAFNGALSGLTGLNTFTQFAHEDLSAMREISFSMNNKLFENSDRDSFDISDSTGYFSFSSSHNSGSGQYGISSDKISDNWKLGYGMAMANINTGNGDGFSRQNKMWLFYMPATYTNDGYELVIAPKAGFANSEYSRRGYNNVNYEGYIEKRIFGLMNDLRYPLSFGNWTFAPDMAFNAIVYTQTGHEEEREFGLVIPDDRTVSVETGLGLYTKYEKTFESGSRLKLNTGLMAYREFGDSYNLKLGIQGMDGTFNLYNNDYKYRGAASMGFDYLMGRFHLYGNAQYFMDNDNYMNFKGGVSYRF